MANEPSPQTARTIVDEIAYMVLGTADAAGVPWATPVYFATDGYRDFYWVSSPSATHSKNIAARPEIGLVIFDSRATIGTGQGVYVRATAGEVPEADLEAGIAVFSSRSVSHGGSSWSVEDVRGAAPIHLYRARATKVTMLAKDGAPDHRVVVDLAG
jgi:nitroimidazol reductase NimA-like FMN-containing flavoprotein (pyridoxamine 5'-phosphate oxidase superfamily)